MAISYTLKGTEIFSFAYIDDILGFSRSPEEHKRHVYEVVNQLDAYGLALNLAKSTIAVSKILMFGHKITNTEFLSYQNEFPQLMSCQSHTFYLCKLFLKSESGEISKSL